MPWRRNAPRSTDWITASQAAEILGVHPSTVATVVDAARVRTRILPGLARKQYRRDDVVKVANGETLEGNGHAPSPG